MEADAAELLGAADVLGAAEVLGAAAPPEPVGADDATGGEEPLGAAEMEGAVEVDGDADGQRALGAGLGEGDADGMSVGAGVGRNPTGSGPTNTRAARMPDATRMPTTRPASMVIPVFIAAEGTSTDGRGRRVPWRCYGRHPVRTLVSALRDRFLPAVLTAAGVTLIAAGLLSYTGSVSAGEPADSAEPEIVAADPGASVAFPSLPPIEVAPSASSLPSATPYANRLATRVVVEALGIDLPIVKARGSSTTYPQCNVAMYIQELSQPGRGAATYLYAHARDGMFGPIYERAILKQSGGPKSMIGMVVQVYTSDDQVYEYQVSEVRLHQLNLDAALHATTEELWLQTSEGPKGTPGKTQLLALPLITLPASHAAAHPVPHPVSCA
jgi:hypothetical protein